VGSLLRLSDPKWAVAVEEAIGNTLPNFLVANPADGRLLQDLAKSVGITNQGIISMNNLGAPRMYDIPAARLPDASLTTMLGVLSSDSAAVMNALIDQGHIEAIVLCDTEAQGKPIAFGKRMGEPLSRNVVDVYLPDGTKMFFRGGSEVTMGHQKNRAARIGADVSKQLETALAAHKELSARLGRGQASRRDAAAAVHAADDAARRAKGRVQATLTAISSAKADLQDAQHAAAAAVHAADADGGAADVAEYEKQLEELAEEGDALEKALVASTAQLQAAAAVAGAARATAAQKDGDAASVAEESTRRAEEMKAAIELVEKTKGYLAHYNKLHADVSAMLAAAEAEADGARKAAAEAASKAAQYCPREEAEAVALPRGESASPSVERLTALLRQAQARMEKEAARNKRPYEDVADDLREASREVKRVRKALEHAAVPAARMREGYKTRHQLLKRTARALAVLVSHRFNLHMHDRGHSGIIVVNYQDGEMRLEVVLANTAPGANAAVQDTKSLSGGERSYTTLSFTLSLNESSDSPFCAMDEWDVFMDAVARKISLDKMLDYASHNRHKQFILITPQDISAVKANDFITIQRLKPARVGS
jgi:chromosome segregation ATPase